MKEIESNTKNVMTATKIIRSMTKGKFNLISRNLSLKIGTKKIIETEEVLVKGVEVK